MKDAAKVFIIIGMVFTFYLIVPIIVGIIAISKMDKAYYKSDLTAISIITLLFCSLVGGICMLCISDEEFKGGKNRFAKENIEKTSTGEYVNSLMLDFYNSEALERLKKMLDDGIITKEEYNEKRKKYIEKIQSK